MEDKHGQHKYKSLRVSKILFEVKSPENRLWCSLIFYLETEFSFLLKCWEPILDLNIPPTDAFSLLLMLVTKWEGIVKCHVVS